MRELELNPKTFDRTTATTNLSPNVARLLQRVNTTSEKGRLLRDRGAARTQMTANTTTVTGSFAAYTQGCNVIQVISDTAGAVKITPGSGCGGPKNEWADSPVSWNNTVLDEDWGFDEPLFSITGTATYNLLGDAGGATARYCGGMCYVKPSVQATPPSNIYFQPYLWIGGYPTDISDTGHYNSDNRGMHVTGSVTQTGVGSITQTFTGICGAGIWQQGRIYWESNVSSSSESISLTWRALQKIFVINNTGASGTVNAGGTFNAAARVVFVRKVL